ncbi:MAG TPA: lasso peptide biosynthesis B2 protein [Thermoanaerobaculia bacterium]|nr:lasso peptide biosynthesis B2 protein [Thermoanaerobaculia bacterium]
MASAPTRRRLRHTPSAWVAVPWLAVRLMVVRQRLRRLGVNAAQCAAPGSPTMDPAAAVGEPSLSLEAAEQLASLIVAAGRLVGARCLERAVLLQTILRRHGAPANLRIGVRRNAGELQAHAWVELQGVPLAEPPTVRERFAPLRRGDEELDLARFVS